MAVTALEFTILMDAGNLSRSVEQARQAVTGGVRGMARAAQEEARRIQSALAGIAGFRELKQGVAEARGEWSKAQGEVSRLA
ncbi:MAG: hypothetical protein HQL59_05250, partial [Magnetococcales bacterium]|nr:hypothetical protein [Magnetococcales bacterium]